MWGESQYCECGVSWAVAVYRLGNEQIPPVRRRALRENHPKDDPTVTEGACQGGKVKGLCRCVVGV